MSEPGITRVAPSSAAAANDHEGAGTPDYAELHCLTNFSFLRGASTAAELVERARKLGYAALAITDECSMAGVVRAYDAAKEHDGYPIIIGSEFRLVDGLRFVLLAEDVVGYRAICRLITTGRRAAEKGEYKLSRADVESHPRDGVLALLLPPDDAAQAAAHAHWLRQQFGERCWIAVGMHRGARDGERRQALRAIGAAHGIRLVATGDVHMHVRRRKALQDTLVAIRIGKPVHEAGGALFANGERHLRRREDLARLYPAELMAESVAIARRCTFSLDELKYEYPHELVPEGMTPDQYLRQLTEEGLRWRWPLGEPPKVRERIENELVLIAELGYAHFFLTVHDIVRYARSRGILCQGRGSAANSSVCFALGITEVNPDQIALLFGRFISRERNEPPDIDVDFEHERREEVLQYVYRKYGRQRAALAATVISYRARSAIRDVGKALGLAADQVEQLCGALSVWDDVDTLAPLLRERGFDPHSPVIVRLLKLTNELVGFPRHLSQHVGGFVISQRPLHELVPVENAAMEDRTVIQWDKDDLESLKLLKVDCLGLGMLSCLRRAYDLVAEHRGIRYTTATLPQDDPETYRMIQRADTLGVFQIESRAQMTMLPRLKPACYYDLVIEVAIVRPGPIQGKMVHPYLRRRQGQEPIDYPEPLRGVLERTLGIPIFQEQVMSLVVIAAGFTEGEADELRRSMAAWRRRGGLTQYHDKIRRGMAKNRFPAEFADQICEQIQGFAEYGFPESHSASFALLVYASCWLKCHEPAVYACALINSQPMGFYQPAQIIQDARRHDVEVRPVDVTASDWDCTLEASGAARRRDLDHDRDPLAIRLGLRLVKGLSSECAGRIAAARAARPFADVQDLVDRAALTAFERSRLAEAGALQRLAGHRHRAHWAVAGAERMPAVLDGSAIAEERVTLVPPSKTQNVMSDYEFTGLSLAGHPVGGIRAQLRARRAITAREAAAMRNGTKIRMAGIVTVRQRPETASGVTFMTLEDETGVINVIVWRSIAKEQRRVLLESVLFAVDGEMQVAEGVHHLVAHRLHDWSALLPTLGSQSRDFH